MKKIIAISLIAATILSFAACSEDKTNPSESETKAAVSTIFITAADPETVPDAITVDELRSLIESIKEEYAAADEITLRKNGTVISAAVKDPGITAEEVTSGTATVDQMNTYITYMANIRMIVCDRLVEYFPEKNKVVFDGSNNSVGDMLFLDPLANGFDSVDDAFAKTISTSKIVADHIIVQNSVAVLYDAESNTSSLFYPTTEENDLLIAVAQKLDPGVFTETGTGIAE